MARVDTGGEPTTPVAIRTNCGSTLLTIDLVPGRGAGFSLEAPEGVRFVTRSDLGELP